ncbi:hypothetical protein L1987_76902 [Smallanthus sonchifolius]|uniref:Uncharacterized protein n=1 Tax=Smallanthus sonchifolius TaxID=185202 RepID=A0ACB8Z8Y3_9ASTR|nr:hypothetical protein L1987_76902 [Smallanthus sonchifolius]
MGLLVTATILTVFSFSFPVQSRVANSTSCPMDFNYVFRIADCRHSGDSTKPLTNSTTCCQTWLSVGISLAQHLNTTSQFTLPDLATSIVRMSVRFSEQSRLLSLPSILASNCFDPSHSTDKRFCAFLSILKAFFICARFSVNSTTINTSIIESR